MVRYKLKKRKNKSHIPFRLNILFFVSFLCFAALFARLAYLQIYRGQSLTDMVQRTEATRSTGSVPRGMIYDSQGKVLVGNNPELAILYTRDKDSKVTPKDIVNNAKQLASLIDIPVQDLSKRDLKDYFIVVNLDLVNSRLSEKEKLLRGTEAYNAQLSKVTDKDIDFSPAELKIAALFKKMNSAYALSTVTVKNKNVTQDEVARVSENLHSLPGIIIGTDWQRTYPQGKMLKSILGQVSTEERGLPSEEADRLTARGYAMNDRVGISYLEQQYEDVLRGTKSISNIITNSSDDILENKQIYEGAKGDNLQLTIDTAFQAKLDKIAEDSLKGLANNGLSDRIYITAINPQNGDVLGISGKRFDYDEKKDAVKYDTIVDDAVGAINTSYGMGSSVKPAMVAMGYMEGAISLDNNVIVDEPLKFQASAEKSSVFNRTGKVPIDDIQAIQRSSNIYMIKMAMKIGGQEYEEDGKLNINENTLNIMRGHFSEFGLGSKTGIDLPNESAGFSPKSIQAVSALDLSYGQFDLYTPLQLAQYSSTIANGGTRYSPRIVKEIRGTDANGELGAVKQGIQPKVMNKIQVDPVVMDRIHQGMLAASTTPEGTASYYFRNFPVQVGSKTGTTEAFYAGPIKYAQNEPVINATYIGFAPYENPEIAISVVIPYLGPESQASESTKVAKDVFQAYFEAYGDLKPAAN
ncbi:peptidoglycan D,D-transpeptidase FtsI family protein [Vaginisenegalia massiliensis]|uniref:peptidoglycan D,D-transpeptidase FtsI family protein n=1 Tax=Vaginisenegalia massiliensis TaxID=2058294 RepID=UPI000F540812|nr:penicillin-binding protein 2 [Vaginisenegalia massiliensis]